MASFVTNMVQRYVDSHAQPIPDYPQPLRVTFLKHTVWFGKFYGTYAGVANFTPAVAVVGAFVCWPYIKFKYNQAQEAKVE